MDPGVCLIRPARRRMGAVTAAANPPPHAHRPRVDAVGGHKIGDDAMTSLARNGGEAGALFDLAGTVATNATWSEDIYFTEAGAPFDISDLDWKLTFRRDGEAASADMTLSTAAGTLAVAADDNGHARILRIDVGA